MSSSGAIATIGVTCRITANGKERVFERPPLGEQQREQDAADGRRDQRLEGDRKVTRSEPNSVRQSLTSV